MRRADLINLSRPAVFGMVLLACGPVPATPDDTAAESTTELASTSTAAITTGPADTSGGHGSTADPTTSTSEEPTDASSSGIHGDPKDMGVDVQCNPFTQDCPPGMKCAPYADDGGTSWNNDKCVPVMENPVQFDEPCFTVGGGLSGFDNCDVGLFCWDVDAEGNGQCIELCSGSPDDGFCKEPGYYCVVYAEAVIPLCIKGCDPVMQDCEEPDVCIANPSGIGFLCVPDASGDEGQQHDPCEFANACDPGLYCVENTAAVECDPNATGCCQPYCDLTDPDADAKCGGVGQVCAPFDAENRLPEYEHVGYCAVPE